MFFFLKTLNKFSTTNHTLFVQIYLQFIIILVFWKVACTLLWLSKQKSLCSVKCTICFFSVVMWFVYLGIRYIGILLKMLSTHLIWASLIDFTFTEVSKLTLYLHTYYVFRSKKKTFRKNCGLSKTTYYYFPKFRISLLLIFVCLFVLCGMVQVWHFYKLFKSSLKNKTHLK